MHQNARHRCSSSPRRSSLAAPGARRSKPPSPRRVDAEGYAADTWHSFDMMLYPATGLVADNVSAEGVRARYTSPTNIGTYLWSTIAARDLGLIIERARRVARIAQTLDTLATLERHAASGQFYNWYDPQTGAEADRLAGRRQHRLPVPLERRQRLARRRRSMMVANAVPQLRGAGATRSTTRWTSASTTTRTPA